jgi:hypothetical protein
MKNNENFYSQWRKSTRGMDLDNQQFIELKKLKPCQKTMFSLIKIFPGNIYFAYFK